MHSIAEKMSFGAHCKNLNEGRPILPVAKCRPMTLVSGDVRFAVYSRRFPREGASNDIGVVDNGNFQLFRGIYFQKL